MLLNDPPYNPTPVATDGHQVRGLGDLSLATKALAAHVFSMHTLGRVKTCRILKGDAPTSDASNSD